MASLALLKLLLLLLLLLLLPFAFATSQSDCNVVLGSSLYPQNENDHWASPSGEFAFGFRHLESPNDEDLFLLAIWFNKIPDKTIVWSANGAPASRGSSVKLTEDGELKLLDNWGEEIWKAKTNGTGYSCAAMLDTGNFVILDGGYDPVWESFKFPTDTILPSQTLAMKSKVSSRKSKTDYTNGRFQLHMQDDGDLVLYVVSMPSENILGPYWFTGTWQPNSSFELVYNESGSMYVTQLNAIVYNLTSKNMGSSKDFYHLARVDSDGVFRQYNHPRRSGTISDGSCSLSWSVVQAFPDDICTAMKKDVISGACGSNSYCVEKNGTPSCLCPDGYSLIDLLDIQKGCKPNFQIPSCQNTGWETNTELIEFREINNTDWQISDYDIQSGPGLDKEMCINYCLYDCFCAAAVYYGNSCAKKKFPLSNGRKISSFNGTTLIKIRRETSTPEFGKKEGSDEILAFILGSSLFINLVLLLAIPLVVFFMYSKKLMNSQADTCAMSVKSYAYKELEEATGGFKEKLGKGAFGTVYKGVLRSTPRRFVAVKNLDKVLQEGEKEFKTEVSVIGQTHHKNLVRLLGYCDEGDHRLLVYEYMSNGSLARLLFGISRPDWNQRVQIAFGIARGIMYLHEECSTQIIHCDIKPQNILLDEYFTPKISDFGLAKLLLAEQTRTACTGIRGTIGYFAPEWFRKASITVKVDVYSFGVMLLEIICCTSSAEFGRWDQEKALVEWAYDCYCKRILENLVENDEEARSDMKRLERLVMVAIWCIQEDPSIRPSMRKITQMLEGVVDVSIPPRPLLFSTS